MISKGLQFTCDILNQFIRNRFSIDESMVVLNTLLESSGAVPQANQNKLVLSLINIEKETNKPFYIHNQKMANDNFSAINPFERANLEILVSANFDNYSEALKFIDTGMLFFQLNPKMDSRLYSTFPTEIQKMEFELVKISYHQMHSLWTAMGAKYQPSVVYLLRLVNFQGNEPRSFTPAVNATANTIN
ncbi:MAG: DUF4255 domain-containing protein [Chitinophagaceae bacterium]|nr:DUF4255 domain-containing protein [Chitinophagaceae bacterium]